MESQGSKVASAFIDAARPSDDEPSAPVWIEVNLSAIRHNLKEVRCLVGPRTQILAVVKANAYGHGLVPVAQALVEAGADLLAVASVREGVALRQHGLTSRILVLGQILPEEAPRVVRHGLTQAIGDIDVAQALSRAAMEGLSPGPPAGGSVAGTVPLPPVAVHLKVDTGMGRYGVWHEEAVALARRLAQLPALRVEGVFTHLATAGQNAEAVEEQIARFTQVLRRLQRGRLPTGLRHIANSVGLLKFPAARQDLVRTGLLLYGASPIQEEELPVHLKPALSLKSRVRFIKTVPAGQSVSYGATFRAARPIRVATIPVGYAHGYTRALSNRAQLLVRGARAPVIGRITMEDLMADVTDIPRVQVGDEVVLIGRQGSQRITAEELARYARTIPYEILAGLSPGIPRSYHASD